MTKVPSPEQVTNWLHAWSDGDPSAGESVMEALYGELQKLARQRLRGERREHTLQPTALVHEAYCRLVDLERIHWRGRAHFLSAAANTMRRILIDHARRRGRGKRGAEFEILPLDEAMAQAPGPGFEVLEVHDALERLTDLDASRGQLVELKYFGGLSNDEVAEVLQCSRATVAREWRLARAWLLRLMQPKESDG